MSSSSAATAIRRHVAKCGVGRITATADGPSPSSSASVSRGASPNARIAGAETKTKTRLTRVRHSAPTRLVPMPLSSVGEGGAALCALASYGGGMLRGDSSDLQIRVEGPGATLGVVTQGSTRIYRSSPTSAGTSHSQLQPLHPDGESESTCRATLRATVEDADGLLVVAPDPVVPYAGSSYVQSQRVDVAPGASAVLVDWFGAGRVVGGRTGGGGGGERWDMDRLSSSSALYRLGGDDDEVEVPIVVESVSLDNRRRRGGTPPFAGVDDDPFGFDLAACGIGDGTVGGGGRGGGPRFDAFASVLLHGPASEEVAARCRSLSGALASEWTRVRRSGGDLEDDDYLEVDFVGARGIDEGGRHSVASSLGLGGRVLFSISRVDCGENDTAGDGGNDEKVNGASLPPPPNRTYVARLAASSNEDAYRILHSVLLPLRDRFGYEFYRDRISASATRVPPLASPGAPQTSASVSSVRNGIGTRTRGVASTTSSSAREQFPSQPHSRGDSPRTTTPSSLSKSWAALMLADSGLPTGGFAHSSGIEAASQLGLFGDGGDDPTQSSSRGAKEGRVAAYVRASTRSAARLHAPFVVAAHRLVDVALSSLRGGDDGTPAPGSGGSSAHTSVGDLLDGVHRDLILLDRIAHAVLSPNAPSCRASIDQGGGLLRVSTHWLRGRDRGGGPLGAGEVAAATVGDDAVLVAVATELLGRIQRGIVPGGAVPASSMAHPFGYGHVGPILGAASALLGLTADEGCDVLGYVAARDVVSAAVRLNLLGPLAGVTVLDGARGAARDGVEAALVAMEEARAEEATLAMAAGEEELVLWGSRPTSSSSLLVAAARAAAGSAPIVDVVHPCHDLLSVRLFRT